MNDSTERSRGPAPEANECRIPEMSDEDVYEAMKSIPGYLDITPGDFRELYHVAYRHALERIRKGSKATDVMTRPVVSVTLESPLEEVARRMAEEHVSGVPVLDQQGNVAGVISEHDFLDRMSRGGAKTFMGVVAECVGAKGCAVLPIRGRAAADIMSAPPVTISEDTPLSEVARLFELKRIHRAPVIDSKGRLTGMVTRTDLLKASFPGDPQ